MFKALNKITMQERNQENLLPGVKNIYELCRGMCYVCAQHKLIFIAMFANYNHLSSDLDTLCSLDFLMVQICPLKMEKKNIKKNMGLVSNLSTLLLIHRKVESNKTNEFERRGCCSEI
jgi:hypothetical protein